MKSKIIIAIILLICIIQLKDASASAHTDIVSIKPYDYKSFEEDLKELAHRHQDILQYQSLGQSVYGREIYLVTMGTGDAVVYIDGSRHAREWISTYINIKKIEAYCNAITYGDGTYGDYNVQELLEKVTFYFVPMVNPDGVDLNIYGLQAIPEESHDDLISMNQGSRNFDRWKANALGIDLNRIWNAGWNTIINSPPGPSWNNYKGMEPFDQRAKEDLYIRELIYKIDPEIIISYHSTGQILYWWWKELDPSLESLNRKIATKVSQMTRYPLYPENRPHTNGGGLTDWFNKEFQRPSLTPELAPFHDNRSVELQWFQEEWERNQYVGLYVAEEAYKLWWERIGEQLEQERKQALENKQHHWVYPVYLELKDRNAFNQTIYDFSQPILAQNFLFLINSLGIQTEVTASKSTLSRFDLARIVHDIVKPNIPTFNYIMSYGQYTSILNNLQAIYFPHRGIVTTFASESKPTFFSYSKAKPYARVAYVEAITVVNRILHDNERLRPLPVQNVLLFEVEL